MKALSILKQLLTDRNGPLFKKSLTGVGYWEYLWCSLSNRLRASGGSKISFFDLSLDFARILPYHWNLRQTQYHGATVL